MSTATQPNPPANPMRPAAPWDIFCRVIDNLGDVGVCWRLASDLADRGLAVRLVIDDASALAWMAPHHASAKGPGSGVQVLPWPGPDDLAQDAAVCIEAFGCDPPPAYVAGMQRRGRQAPVWLNLEYLSAEGYVERSHRLPSPQHSGLTKWFYYPGFTPKTGGLLRELDLAERQGRFDRDAWLAKTGIDLQPGERLVSLFCYAASPLPDLLQALADQPTRVLLAPGPAQQEALAWAAGRPAGPLRLHAMPWVAQRDFDELLWACDLNFVRGEDSMVRALWAGKPFVWQAYRQQDGAHFTKVQALLENWSPDAALHSVRTLWAAWNGMSTTPWPGPLPDLLPWQQSVHDWRQRLWQMAPLAQQLLDFVHGLQLDNLAAGTAPAARI